MEDENEEEKTEDTGVAGSPVQQSSPVVPPSDDGWPLCPGSKTPVKQVRYLDFQDIRVVFDTDTNIVLGVMPVPK